MPEVSFVLSDKRESESDLGPGLKYVCVLCRIRWPGVLFSLHFCCFIFHACSSFFMLHAGLTLMDMKYSGLPRCLGPALHRISDRSHFPRNGQSKILSISNKWGKSCIVISSHKKIINR